MTEIILGQVQFIVMSLWTGMLLMMGYDILRFLRFVVPHCKVAFWIEDILYWSVVAIPVFIMFYRYNLGELRWYGVAAVIGGAVIYDRGISNIVRTLGNHLFTRIRKKYAKLGVHKKNKATKKRNIVEGKRKK